MIEPGKYNQLEVKSKASVGIFLTDGIEDILLPQRYAPSGLHEGDTLEVFVYLDNENRPIATTEKPFAQVGDFAFLEVKEVNQHGAFLDWGISKDLFVAFPEQRRAMDKGQDYLVYVFIDETSGRIAATSRWSRYLLAPDELETGEEVELLIAEKTDLGYRAIINNLHDGLIYKNEVFEELELGDRRRGFIRVVREDGKVDLRLQAEGYSNVENSRHIILHYLRENGGLIPLGDKSPAEDIYQLLKISKKTFKKTIGGLYKQRLITMSDDEVRLIVH